MICPALAAAGGGTLAGKATAAMDPSSQQILICGVRGLGQACVRALPPFGVPPRCLNDSPPSWNQGEGLPALEDLVNGEMRHPKALQVRLLNPAGDALLWLETVGGSERWMAIKGSWWLEAS